MRRSFIAVAVLAYFSVFGVNSARAPIFYSAFTKLGTFVLDNTVLLASSVSK